MDTTTIDSFQLQLGGWMEGAMALNLAFMMFAVALGLKAEHFKFFKEEPRIYLAGVAAQIIGLPLLTLALCFILKPIPSMALGMILISCCPGGNVSNLLSLYGRGNTALSVSLTATSSLFAAFMTPVSILFWCSLYPPTRNLLNEIDFDTSRFLLQTLFILALPILLGMLTVHLAPALAQRIHRPLATIAGLGLLAIIVVAIVRFAGVFFSFGPIIFGLVFIHNTLALGLGYLTGRLTKADIPARRALTFEVGIQNSGLGLVILITQLNGLGGAGTIAGLWGVWHIGAGLALVWFFRRQDRRTHV